MIPCEENSGILLYRATVDGFTSQAFHSKCDGKENTITIIKTDENSVFGGYASSAWNSSSKSIKDSNAFLFSLRRGGVSFKDKFIIKKCDDKNALYGDARYGPIFGGFFGPWYKDCDILIENNSNTTNGSFCEFGTSFRLPDGCKFTTNSRDFFAGSFDQWTTTEIEVYQLIK